MTSVDTTPMVKHRRLYGSKTWPGSIDEVPHATQDLGLWDGHDRLLRHYDTSVPYTATMYLDFHQLGETDLPPCIHLDDLDVGGTWLDTA